MFYPLDGPTPHGLEVVGGAGQSLLDVALMDEQSISLHRRGDRGVSHYADYSV